MSQIQGIVERDWPGRRNVCIQTSRPQTISRKRHQRRRSPDQTREGRNARRIDTQIESTVECPGKSNIAPTQTG